MAATKSDKPGAGRQPRPASVKGAPGPVTSASTWKRQTVEGTLLTVPSGAVALVRAPGMQVFLKEGVIPNALMPIVQEAMVRGTAPSDEDMGSLVDDPKKIQEIMNLADSVTIFCCIDPKVHPIPVGEVIVAGIPTAQVIPFGDPKRDPDILYVDEIDFNDKMFIFNFAVGGGTADFAKFRS